MTSFLKPLTSLLPEIAMAPTALLLFLIHHALAAALVASLCLVLVVLRLLQPDRHRRIVQGLESLAQGVAALLSLVVMVSTYFLVLTPLALLLRLTGRDSLATGSKSSRRDSEWHDADARRYDDDFFKTQF